MPRAVRLTTVVPPTGGQTPRLASTRPLQNRFTPPIPQPAEELKNLAACVAALKACVESLIGQRGDASNRAVTFNDLVIYGILDPSAVQSPHGQADLGGGGAAPGAGGVTSVAGKTGDVVLNHNDIVDWSSAVVTSSPVQSVAGKTGNVTLTHNDITDFSSAAAAAAPVQTVAGKTGNVTLTHSDITDWDSNVGLL